MAIADDQARLLTETAGRLRMVQADFADDDRAERRRHLAEVVGAALEGVPVGDRQGFIAGLLEHFPAWGDASAPVAELAPLPDEPWPLVERLVDLAESMDEATSRAISTRLSNAGLVPPPQRIVERAEAPASGLAGVAESMAECLRTLDQIAGRTWQEISTGSARCPNVRDVLDKFNAGEVGSEQVEEELNRLRQLLAALILAIRSATGEFALQHQSRFSVDSIMKLSKHEGKKFAESWELKYWRKYAELAENLSEATIEREIMQAIAGYAGRMMDGPGSTAR